MTAKTLSRRSALANGLAMTLGSPLAAIPALGLPKHPDATIFALVAKCESARAAADGAWAIANAEIEKLTVPQMPDVLRQPVHIEPWPLVYPPMGCGVWNAKWLRAKLAEGDEGVASTRQYTDGAIGELRRMTFAEDMREAFKGLLAVAEAHVASNAKWSAAVSEIEATAIPFDDAATAALRELAACPAQTIAGLAAKAGAFKAASLLQTIESDGLDSEALAAVLRDVAALASQDANS